MILDFIDKYNYRKKDADQEKDFNLYANPKTKKIDEDGMVKMGKTLGIDIYTDTFITFFFFCCGMKNLEEVTKDQFKKGLTAFKCNSLAEVKYHIMDVKGELMDINSKIFKQFYYFLFEINYIKKEKSISMEVVDVYFNSFFSDQFAFVRLFLIFIKDVKKLTGLTKDQWDCFLDLLLNLGGNYPNGYNCEDYYPSLFDEFYRYYCEQNGIKIEKNEDE